MPSDPSDPSDQIEARATAFVFGELDREEATEFMMQMAASTELQSIVASIRETIGTLQGELAGSTAGVSEGDRRRIEMAMKAVNSEPPPFVPDTSDGSRQWVIGLAVAATLLLACGLTLPALNRAITASTDTRELQEKIRKIELENERLLSEKQIAERELATLKTNQVRETARGETADGTLSNQGDKQVRTEDPADQRSVESESPAVTSTGSTVPVASAGENKGNTNGGGQPSDPISASVEMIAGDQEGPSGQTVADQSLDEAGAEDSIGGEEAGFEQGDQEDFASGSENEDISFDLADSSNTPTDIESSFLDSMDATQGRGGSPSPARSRRNRRIAADERGGMKMGMDEMGMDMTMGGLGATDEAAFGMVETGGFAKGGDRFSPVNDHSFRSVTQSPLSTFSIDVDSAAYSKVRMYLMQYQQFPVPDAVRIEELVNYFRYDYEPPKDDRPFAAEMEVASCPWNPKHRLARIGIKGKVIDEQRPASNLVFLLDVSGSMKPANKLPLVIDGMKMLVNQLGENDSVAIVVYAGAAGMVLDSTTGDRKKVIVDSLDRLRAGGSTRGGKGIQLAYQIARDHFIDGGINRVILCSDGDFNVGVTGTEQLVKMAAENAKDDIFLTVLGFGMGNHNGEMMEQISNRGNGNYAFIGNADDARRVLVEQMEGTPVTIAKDVEIQVEFNPMEVETYRLIGYENRMLADQDFDEDRKDAGEIGAGHTVTALYELVPKRDLDAEDPSDVQKPMGDLKYQRKIQFSDDAQSGELLTVKIRYKEPTADLTSQIEFTVKDTGKPFSETDRDFQFAASVAAFGMLLSHSPHKGNANYEMVEQIAIAGAQNDLSGYRDRFISLVKRARLLARR
jgi:Ca-activated chloride channel family protein